MPKNKLNLITKRIKASGKSQREWATSHGFKPQTVANVINGSCRIYGEAGIGKSGEIINQLKNDGFWEEKSNAR